MHYSFDGDIVDGRKAEYFFMFCMVDALGKHDKILPSHTDYKGKDIIVTLQCGYEFTFEIKNDMKAQETGNVGIEFECRGSQSGINVTKANYWVQFYDKQFLVIPTHLLKELINQNLYHRVAVGGDKGSNTKMYLFSKSEFEKHAKILNISVFKDLFLKTNTKYNTY